MSARRRRPSAASLFAIALLFAGAAPDAEAGSFGVYGSYWDSDEADSSIGGGARIGFEYFKILELEFHGTYFPDFNTDAFAQAIDLKTTAVDGGLRVNLIPAGPVNPFAGAGVSYYFLDSDLGDIENETGWYAEAGLDVGSGAMRFTFEVLWRKVDTSISLGAFDEDADFDGISANGGFTYRW